jgi:dehydrogenase/reductase SDR family protein 12
MSTTSISRDVVDRALECTVVGSFSRIGFSARRALFNWDASPEADLHGRVVVVTGATGGLGLAAAHLLARRGASLFLVGRDAERTKDARASVIRDSPGAQVKFVVADLADLDAVRRAAAELQASSPRVDALIHNAGALVSTLQRVNGGHERTAQVHVVSPFLLTTLLLPALRAGDGARVISVSSGGMYTRRLDIDALDTPREPFDGVRVYANAKRAEVVLNEQWARHPAGRGIHFHAMHPGWADTPGVRASLPRFRRIMRPILRTPEQGADTMAWLAGTDEALDSNGAFWLDRRRRATNFVPWTRTIEGDGERLWDWCVERSGVAP